MKPFRKGKSPRVGWWALLLIVIPFLANGQTGMPGLLALFEEGDHFLMIRHALAPGSGDPAEFRLADPTTQRNLSEAGRRQARAIGSYFRESGLTEARVLTSQWHRCRETARLMGLGPVEDMPSLNSFFQRRSREGPQMRALKDWLAEQDLTRPTLLVTHQVVITSLTGYFPQSGELVIVRRAEDGFEMVKTVVIPIPD